MKKYLLTIEFRYTDSPDVSFCEHVSKTATIGIYDEYKSACDSGNNVLMYLESIFPLHVFPKGNTAQKERLSTNGGCFGGKRNLVTNLAYLSTPFSFYLEIVTLNYFNIDDCIDDALKAIDRHKKYKSDNLD